MWRRAEMTSATDTESRKFPYNIGTDSGSVLAWPKSICIRCGSADFLTRIPYGSVYDGDWICGVCIDRLLGVRLSDK